MKKTIVLTLMGLLWVTTVQAQVYPVDVTVGPGLGIAIPDNGYDGSQGSMACSSLTVGSSNDQILSATVETRINHTWVGDLTLKLYSPTGEVVTLASMPGMAESADDGTSGSANPADLSSTNPITFHGGSAHPSAETMGTGLSSAEIVGDPASGSSDQYESNSGSTSGRSLTALTGTAASGTWNLCVGDSVGGDSGTIDGWTLHLIMTPCADGEYNLCLLHNNLGTAQFSVTMDYLATSGGNWEHGRSVGISDQAGYFYFTNPANMEILVKMIDACTVTNSYWIFVSGLTDRGIGVRVERVGLGSGVIYGNNLGDNFTLVKDFTSFTCQ